MTKKVEWGYAAWSAFYSSIERGFLGKGILAIRYTYYLLY